MAESQESAEPIEQRRARVRQLIAAAKRIADADDPFGVRARERLTEATSLSAEGVELGLSSCLEVAPRSDEVRALCESVASADRCHVLLASNVFVAAHRAIALALASSSRVEVRPSRRDPVLTELLHEASRGAFRIVDDLTPAPGDHVWAYGSDETLASLRGELPAGVVLHGHGAGYGVVVVGLDDGHAEPLRELARRIARDTIVFDQLGCLSPRVVFALGSAERVEELGRALADELTRAEGQVPRGALDESELGELIRYRDTMAYAAQVLPAGKGWVGVDSEGHRVLVPPPTRSLHVVRVDELDGLLGQLRPAITTASVAGSDALLHSVRELLPRARLCAPGHMQRPPFDGPVDRRGDPEGETL